MGRLSRPEIKKHEQALRYIDELDSITNLDTREKYEQYVLNNFDPAYSSAHLIVNAGIFFTPVELAKDFRIEAQGQISVIDLCAGIGHLSYWMQDWVKWEEFELICVEINPEFVAIGKRLVPKAAWICADILDPDFPGKYIDKQIDFAVCNPPFGKNMAMKKTPHLKYTGGSFEFKAIEVAGNTAKSGAFIIPQSSSPIIHYPLPSQSFNNNSKEYNKFNRQTGICLENNCGIDANGHQWKGAFPKVEIVTCDFTKRIKHIGGDKNIPLLFPL